MNTTEENDDVRQTLRQAMPDDLPPAVAERMQSRLAAFCNRLDAESEKPRNRISQWIGGFTMRQRIAVLRQCWRAAAVLGFLLLWGGFPRSRLRRWRRWRRAFEKRSRISAR